MGTYIALVVLYNFYLGQYLPFNDPDPYTVKVAEATSATLNAAGFDASAVKDEQNPYMNIIMDGQVTTIVNEGCNAISILIIFVAFVIAFSTTFLQTGVFIFAGLIILQIMNVLRIAFLNYIYRYHYDYGEMTHDYVFPAVIYGSIVVLWIVWVKFFVFKKHKISI